MDWHSVAASALAEGFKMPPISREAASCNAGLGALIVIPVYIDSLTHFYGVDAFVAATGQKMDSWRDKVPPNYPFQTFLNRL